MSIYLRNLSTDRQRQTDRHTDVAICTWLRLYVVRLLLVCAGCGHPGLADGVIGGERQPETRCTCCGSKCRTMHSKQESDTNENRQRQTHGRGYMYLAQSVNIVRCKTGDLYSRLYLRNLSTGRQTDTRTWLYVPGPGCTYSLL